MANVDLSKLRIDQDAKAFTPRPRSRRGRWWWIGGLLVAAAIAASQMVGKRAATVETATVALAYPSQAITRLNATGYVVAQRKASVASKATGRLEWLGVAEGSKVKAGEILARLENADVTATSEQALAAVNVARANLLQAEAELADARLAAGRSTDLLARKFISAASHDSALARLNKAQAAVGSAKASIAMQQASARAAQVAVESTIIRAPFDGVVLVKHANVGDVMAPFAAAADSKGAVVTMADMDTLEVEADVSEASLSKVQVDQPCEIQLDALPDRRFRGTVARMVPTVDRAKATVLAKIRFIDRDPRILPEMSAKVAFLERDVKPDEQTARIAANPKAVVERDGKPLVFVLENGVLHARNVTTGAKLGDVLEIRSGLKVGDKVVLSPDAKLADGMPAKLAEK